MRLQRHNHLLEVVQVARNVRYEGTALATDLVAVIVMIVAALVND